MVAILELRYLSHLLQIQGLAPQLLFDARVPGVFAPGARAGRPCPGCRVPVQVALWDNTAAIVFARNVLHLKHTMEPLVCCGLG